MRTTRTKELYEVNKNPPRVGAKTKAPCYVTMDSDAMQAPVQDIIEKINNTQSAAVVSWAQSGITDIECKRRMGEFVDSIYAELQAFQKKQEARAKLPEIVGCYNSFYFFQIIFLLPNMRDLVVL